MRQAKKPEAVSNLAESETARAAGELGRQRIDKWLFHARVVRTRSAAAALASSGHVRINGRRVTAASRAVRAGDILTIALDRVVLVLRVEGLVGRRGGAASVSALYRELERE
jgi:ribosome-associated heat shock protein Hsp15